MVDELKPQGKSKLKISDSLMMQKFVKDYGVARGKGKSLPSPTDKQYRLSPDEIEVINRFIANVGGNKVGHDTQSIRERGDALEKLLK